MLKVFAYFKIILKTLCSSALILLFTYYLNTEKIDYIVNSNSSCKQSDIGLIDMQSCNKELLKFPSWKTAIHCLKYLCEFNSERGILIQEKGNGL